MNIYTLTLNPAYDVHAYTAQFTPYRENLADIQSRDAGGKGVNISRALKNAGVDHTSVVVLGTDNGADFKTALAASGLDCMYLERPGRIRENLTLHCGNAPETRISFTGFTLDKSVLEYLLGTLQVNSDTYITYTGRNPKGISKQEAMDFLMALQNKGAKIVLDSKSFNLQDMLALRPWLIKPNQEEISELFGCEIQDFDACVEKATTFASNGIENTMVSLGEQGALLIHSGDVYIAQPPVIDAVSTIGAGDSSIAGFLTAAAQHLPPDQCLATAVSFGSAACLTEGTLPPEMDAADKIRSQIKLRKL